MVFHPSHRPLEIYAIPTVDISPTKKHKGTLYRATEPLGVDITGPINCDKVSVMIGCGGVPEKSEVITGAMS